MTKRSYPLQLTDDRKLQADYQGDVFIWDIDKTYLATHFSSVKGLARIPLEFAVDKESIAGMPEVLRGLRRGPGPTFAAAPLYFVSSSPPQLRRVVAHKMLIDGVQPDGFVFKDWITTLRQARPRRLRDHLGYKLCALLQMRLERPLCREFLFGDDVERDAETYSLYASILDGDLTLEALEGALITGRVADEDRRYILELVDRLPGRRGRVGQVFIHLARGTEPDELETFGALVVPVRNACQLSLCLYEATLVDRDTVIQATNALLSAPGGSKARLDELLDDAIRRRLITDQTLADLGL